MHDPIDERTQPRRSQAVVDEASLAALADQARLAEHGEMLGDRGLGDARVGDQVTHRRLTTRQSLEDRATAAIRQGAEDVILAGHRLHISRGLWLCQAVRRHARSSSTGSRSAYQLSTRER